MTSTSVVNNIHIRSENDIKRFGNLIKDITERTKQKFDFIDREIEDQEIRNFISSD